MKLSDLDFQLPEELIARNPTQNRTDSRLMVINSETAQVAESTFSEFHSFLRPKDLLVLNTTKVLSALSYFYKPSGGKLQVLYLSHEKELAHCFVSGAKIVKGQRVFCSDNRYSFMIQERNKDGSWVVKSDDISWQDFLNQYGFPPLPPYIRRMRKSDNLPEISLEDEVRYQTIWAKDAGSVAAPTASLHFDRLLMGKLKSIGVEFADIYLHVGQGTFAPIRCEEVSDHPIHSEYFKIDTSVIEKIKQCRTEGGRVIAVGTTVCRALEGWARGDREQTNLMILPGHKFELVDGLLTNFHTPQSTLLALVSAFAEFHGASRGIDLVKTVYQKAVDRKYRFYSFGDASFWIKP